MTAAVFDPTPGQPIFGHDEFPLRLCAEWRAARARYQVNCAEHNAANMYGHLPDLDLSGSIFVRSNA
jgi:hypothetical protein